MGVAAVALLAAFAGSSAAARGQRWGPNDPDPPFGLFETEASAAQRPVPPAVPSNAVPQAGQLNGPAMGPAGSSAPAVSGARRDPAVNGGGQTTTATASSAVLAAAAGDANVPVGTFPTGVAANNTRAYVANTQSNSVSVIDLTAVPPTVIATIPVGAFPVGVALSADGSQAYVTNYNANTLSIISTATNSVTNTVPVGSRPNGVIRVGASVYVANLTGNSISVVNPATATVTNTVVLGGSPAAAPSGLAANAGGTRLYASDAKNGKLIVLNLTVSPPTILSSSATVGTFPAYLSVANGTGYVANPGSNNVSVLNLAPNPPTVTATVPVGTADYGVVAQPSLGQVFVTNSGSNNGSVVDSGTNTVVGTFPTGTKPNAIVLTPNGLTAVFSNQGSNTASVLHVNQRPVNTVPGAQMVNGNATAVGNKITFSPGNVNAISTSDDSESTVQVTVSSLHGNISLSTTAGLTGVSGNGTHTVMFTGALADVNTALDGMTYTPDTTYFGPDTLTFTVNDQGNTGIGKAQTDVDTISITVVNAAPVVGNVSFSGAVGNTIFGVGTTPAQPSTNTAGNVLSASSDPNGGTLSAVSGMITTANSGTVNMNANGTFTYVSAPGFTGADTFTFQVTDGTNTTNGTATVNVADRVWYVNNALGVNGNGTSVSPFNTLANLRGAGDADSPGDFIFLFTGSGAYSGGLPLEDNQQLIGQPQNLVVGAQTLWTGAGTNPTITNAAGVGIVLAQNNVIRRVNVANTSSAGINGSGINNTDIGPNMTISGSGGAGFALFGGGSGTVTFAANVTHASAAGRSVFIGGRTGGTVTISGSVNDTAGGIGLDTNTGTTINFTGTLTIATTGNEAFRAIGGGTVNVTGSGSTLSATTAAVALEISNTTIGASGVTFQSVSKNGGTNGIVLNTTGSTGGLTVTGTGSAGSGGTIQNTSGDGISLTNVGGVVSLTNMATSNVAGTDVLLSGGGANVTYSGTITNQAGKNRSVVVQNKTGGTVLFSGAINDQGTGISLSSNTGATVNFTGGVTVSATGPNHAFSATGGGTVNVTGSNNTLDHPSGTGAALNIQNTTIGGSGLTFKSISANGGDNGIVLVNSGSGALTVAGTGTAGSGGTIQNMTSGADGATSGIGVRLQNVSNVSLNRMNLHDFSNWAIQGSTVSNFTLAHSTINGSNGSNASFDEGSVRFTELTGSASINNTTIQGGIEDNVTVVNTTGTLNRLTFDTVTIGPNSVANGNDGISLEGQGGTFNVTVQNSTFTSAGGDLFQHNVIGTAASDLIFKNNQLSNNHTNIAGGGGGMVVAVGGSGDLTYDIDTNTFRDAKGSALVVNKAFGGAPGDGTASGKIRNNTIGVSGVANSGSSEGSGIFVGVLAGGVHTTLIDNNDIFRYTQHGIFLQAGGTSQSITGVAHNGDLNATIQNNVIAQPNAPGGGLAQNGIHLNSGTNSTGGNDNYDVCLGFSANTLTNSGALGGTDYRLRQRFDTDVRLPGYTGAANGATDADLTAYLTPRTTGAFTLSSSSTATGGFFNTPGGAACPLPA